MGALRKAGRRGHETWGPLPRKSVIAYCSKDEGPSKKLVSVGVVLQNDRVRQVVVVAQLHRACMEGAFVTHKPLWQHRDRVSTDQGTLAASAIVRYEAIVLQVELRTKREMTQGHSRTLTDRGWGLLLDEESSQDSIAWIKEMAGLARKGHDFDRDDRYCIHPQDRWEGQAPIAEETAEWRTEGVTGSRNARPVLLETPSVTVSDHNFGNDEKNGTGGAHGETLLRLREQLSKLQETQLIQEREDEYPLVQPISDGSNARAQLLADTAKGRIVALAQNA